MSRAGARLAGSMATFVIWGATVVAASPTDVGDGSCGVTIALEAPRQGVLYVRYGPPGAVRLHRGNLASLRGSRRADLGPQGEAGAEAEARAASSSSRAVRSGTAETARTDHREGGERPLLAVLRDFGSSPQSLDGIVRLGAAGAVPGTAPGAEPVPGTIPRVEPLSRPLVVQAIPKEEQALDAGELVPSQNQRTEEPRGATEAVVGSGLVSVDLVAGMDSTAASPGLAVLPRSVASPETLEIALRDRQVVQTQAILFETARVEILPGSLPMLESLAKVLREAQDIRLRVEGHTDVRGTESYNQALSERRAAAISDWLSERGIAPGRVEAIGFGEGEPLDPRTTLEAHALNRRVVFRVLPEAAPAP